MDYWDSKRSTPLFRRIDHDGRVLYGVTTEVFVEPESDNEAKEVDTLYFGPSLDPSAVVGQAYDETGELVSWYINIALRVEGSLRLWKTLKDCYDAGKVSFTSVIFVDLSSVGPEDLFDDQAALFNVQTADEIFNKLGM